MIMFGISPYNCVEEAVLKQDVDATDIFDDTIRMWAANVVNLTTVLDSDVIIMGGIINTENSVILSRMRHFVTNTLNCDIDIRLADSHHRSQYAGGIYFLKQKAISNIVREMFSENGE